MLTKAIATAAAKRHLKSLHLFHSEDDRYVFHGIKDDAEIFALVYVNHISNAVTVRLDLDGSGNYDVVAE